jgi:hypothetical protein
MPPRELLVIPANFTLEGGLPGPGDLPHVSGEFAFSGPGTTLPRLMASNSNRACPTSVSTTSTRFSYVGVRNDTTRTVTVSIWQDQGSGSPAVDTIIAAYADGIPLDSRRDTCIGFANDDCAPFGRPCAFGGYAALNTWTAPSGSSLPTIGPGQTLVIHSALWRDVSDHPLRYRLNVRVDAMQ